MKPFYKRLLSVVCLLGTLTAYSQGLDTLEIKRNESGKILFARFKPNNDRKFTDASDFLKTVLQAKLTIRHLFYYSNTYVQTFFVDCSIYVSYN